MAVQKVYEAQLDSRTGDTYRVCIYDLDYTAGTAMSQLYGEPQVNLPIELTVLHDTPEIRWDAEPDDIAQPIIGSSFSLGLLLGEGDDNKIKDVIKDRPEHTLAVEVERHNGGSTSLVTASNWDVIWRGVLVHEAIEYSWSNYPQEISLTFTDGLSLLRDRAYVNSSGDSYSSNGNRFAPLRVQIGRCLEQLPHNALWGEQELYFTELLDLYSWNHIEGNGVPFVIKSVLDKTGCNQDLWYEFREHDTPYNRKSIIQAGGSTCYEILTDIMVAMGIQLTHSEGIFQVISPFAIDTVNRPLGERRFRADKRTMLDPNFQYSDYTQTSGDADGTDYPANIDYRDPEKILIGSSLSYLPSVKGVMFTHLKGGAPYAFFPSHPVRIVGNPYNATEGPSNPGQGNYNPNAGGQVGGNPGSSNFIAGPTFPLENDTTIAPGGESLRLKGRVYRVGLPLEDGDDALVGIQPILRFKIQVGNYYLKQTVGLKSASDFTNDSDFGNIRLAIGNIMSTGGTDITTWLPIEITDEVEWTTVESFFDLPYQLPGVNQPDVDVIEYDTGSGVEEYPVGMFTVRDSNHSNQMRFRNEHANYDTDLVIDMVTPELPTAVAEHTGVSIDCTLRAYDNTGTLLTGSGNSGAPDFGLNGNTEFCIGMYIDAFRVIVGLDETDEDTQYFASQTNPPGSEIILGGETTLGTRPHDSYGEIGALTVDSPGHRTTGYISGLNTYKDYWFSNAALNGGTPLIAAQGRKSLQVLAEEYYRSRANVLNTVAVELILETRYQTLLHPGRQVVLEQGSTDPIIQIQGCSHLLMSGVQVFNGYQRDKLVTGTVITDTSAEVGNSTKGPRPPGGGIPPGPVSVSKTRISGTGSGITAEQQTKLATITLDGSQVSNFNAKADSIAAASITTSSSRNFVTNSQLTDIQAIAANTAKRSFPLDKENEVTANTNKDGITAQQAANINTNLAKVTFPGFGTSAGKAMEGDTTTITTEQANNINNNLLKISYPPADANKVARLTVTAATDLDTMRTDVASNNAKVSYTDASAVAANTAKVSFPGFGTTSSTALAGDTTTITSGQANAIVTNLAKTGITGAQAAAIVANTTVTDHFTLDGSDNITGIALQTNAIAAAAIAQSSGLQFISSSELAAITTNTSNVSTLQSEVQAIEDVIQSVTSGGGKGVYFNSTKVTTNAHVTVGDKAASLFAGSNTGVAVTETSPGTVALHVQAGSSGSEVQVTAMTIVGSGTLQNATVTFSQPVIFSSSVSGLTSSTITEGSKLFYTNARADARIALANVSDLSDVTDAGSGSIITSAERTKLNGIEAGAEVNVDTSLSNADQTIGGTRLINLGASGELKVKSNGVNGLTPFSIESNGNDPATIRVNGDFRMDSGALSGGILKLEEAPNTGANFVALQAPTNLTSDVTYKLPASDGSSGQFIQTDGSGNLSFASASGGSSDTIKHFYAGGAQLAYPFGRYLPLTGDVIEQNTSSSALSRTGFVAPYDGQIKKIMARSQETLGNTVLQWYKAVDGTHAPATSMQSVTVDIDTANTTFTYTYSSATFSKGDILSLKVDPTSDPVSSTMEFNYTIEFEFDTST